VTTREAMDHENSPWLAEARLYFAQCLLRLGQREMARAQLTAANQAIRSHPALAPPFTALLRRTAGMF
jgi:hypothetical protein